MELDDAISAVARAIELIGVGALLIGTLLSAGSFLRDWVGIGLGVAYHQFRANLGRSILLGLELLVAADIIRTVAIEPTLQNLAVLGLVVLIRTFLSFTLEIEISGVLPWRRGPEDPPHHAERI
jgi:uncharacterized membrane protein